MTTATVSTGSSGTHGIDRVALRVGTALVQWAARRAERHAPTLEQRNHHITLERLQLDRATAAQRTMLGR